MSDASDENRITLLEAIAYCAGDIIGSGVFVSPTSILVHTGSIGLSLVIWLLGAVIAVCGSLVYADLGTKIRKSGCDFAYLCHAKWTVFAVPFLYVSCFLIYPSILAIQTLTFGKYMIKGLETVFKKDLEPHSYVLERLIGFTALWIVFYINLYSLRKFAGRFQLFSTITKFAMIALIICTGLFHFIFKSGTNKFQEPFKGSVSDPGEIVLGLCWDILNFGSEEIVNPRRTLPLAAICSIAIAVLTYFLINIAYFSVLTVEEFKASETVAVTFAERTLGNFSLAIPFIIAFLILGSMNTTVFGCSRYALAGAHNGYLPSFLKTIHLSSMSPRAAIVAETMVAIGLAFLGDLENLLGSMTFAMWAQRCIVACASLWMRFRDFPFPKDAFSVPIVLPFLWLPVCVSLLIVPIIGDYRIAIWAFVLIITGLIIYMVFIFPNRKPKIFTKADEAMIVCANVTLNTEMEE